MLLHVTTSFLYLALYGELVTLPDCETHDVGAEDTHED
jgi:hypothetical protein